MTRWITRGALVMAVILAGTAVRAADPVPDEPLPVPRPYGPAVGVGPAGIPIGSPYYRRSRYEVWQYYGVARSGNFRPLVVYSPSGPYYLYNHAPFPWATEHQREFMPYIVEAPGPMPPVPAGH
jgi:hypothetical protein